jgi:hypothetical protein
MAMTFDATLKDMGRDSTRGFLAVKIFGGVRVMHESDTYLMILEEGEAKATKENILVLGEERLGSPPKSVRAQVNAVTDLPRLKRMVRRTAKAANWQEIVDTP